jgi:hypothetical protein
MRASVTQQLVGKTYPNVRWGTVSAAFAVFAPEEPHQVDRARRDLPRTLQTAFEPEPTTDSQQQERTSSARRRLRDDLEGVAHVASTPRRQTTRRRPSVDPRG